MVSPRRVVVSQWIFGILFLVFMPLSVPGDPVLTLGPLSWSREGVARSLLIAVRAAAIATALRDARRETIA